MKRFSKARIVNVCVCALFCFSACHGKATIPPAPPPDLPKQTHNTAASHLIDVDTSEVWDVSSVPLNCVTAHKKHICFTFDDSPASTLENIVSAFLAFNQSHPDCQATATLFCNGIRCTPHALQALQTAHLIGFELGNHTHSHVDLTKLSEEQLQAEIDRTDKILQRIDGKKLHLLRAPFGCVDEQLCIAAQTPIISWTIDTLDWTGVSADDIYNSVWNKRFDGAIVLMHDGYPNTIDALKRLLPDLYADGYQVVSVSALSKANACPLKRGKVYIRARKNGSSC